VRTCVSNRDTDPPIQKLLHTADVLCIDYYAACQRKNRANRWNGCHPRVERPRQQAQKKKCWDFVCALLELAIWLQAGEDRAIAAGSQADLKTGCPRLTTYHSSTPQKNSLKKTTDALADYRTKIQKHQKPQAPAAASASRTTLCDVRCALCDALCASTHFRCGCVWHCGGGGGGVSSDALRVRC
jgi:hypothetical protein